MHAIILRRLGLLLCGIAVWSLMLFEIFTIRQADSRTPIVNNIRRALNDCQVFGRLSQEIEGNVSFVSFNSRIVCDQNTSPQR
jgi:hypothetical protein